MKILKFFAVFAFSVFMIGSMIGYSPVKAVSYNLFLSTGSESFESHNFSNWTSVDNDWNITHGSGHSGSHKAVVTGQGPSDDILLKNISTVGYSSVTLSYYWRVTNSDKLEADDHVYVEWTDDNWSSYAQLAHYTDTWSSTWNDNYASFSLPASADDNSNFGFRFRASSLSGSDEFQLDDVSLVAGGIMASPSPSPTPTSSVSPTPSPIPGCMDQDALNYNPLATVDDQSCIYPSPSPSPSSSIDPSPSPLPPENTLELCSNQIDDDGDQLIDLDDPDCAQFAPSPTPTPSAEPSPTPSPSPSPSATPLPFPVYEGQNSCPVELPVESLVGSYTIEGDDVDGESFDMNSGGKYLFKVNGTFVPTLAANWFADAAYSTNDSWGSVAANYGSYGTGDNYGAHSLLADLGLGVGIVPWGGYSTNHDYSFFYEPLISSLQFVIGDRFSTWFDTPWDNQAGMLDNSGFLTLDVYECQAEEPLPLCANGLDDDQDGLIDGDDPGCTGEIDNDETDPVVYQCSDGQDNDDDGLVDYGEEGDPDCTGPEDDNESTEQQEPPLTPTPTWMPQCSDGIDNDQNGLTDYGEEGDPGCSSPEDDSEPVDQHGSPGYGSPSGGSVLGASTEVSPEPSPVPQVLGESTAAPSCGLFLGKFLKFGWNNDSEAVKKLQEFLNEKINANLPVTGFFGSLTHAAVQAFQKQHAGEILDPWFKGLEPTGFVYLTTQRWINKLMCGSLELPLPTLVPFK